MAENIANETVTTLAAPGITGTARPVTFTVASNAGFAAPNSRVKIDNELLLITAKAGGSLDQWTGTNVEGTAAALHSAGAEVYPVLTAAALLQYITEQLGIIRIDVKKDNALVTVGPRRYLNFLTGNNLSLAVLDDAVNDEVDITIAIPTINAARVYNSVDQSIPSGAFTVVTFDSERFDSGGLHSIVTNTGRLTAVTAGKHIVSGCVRWAANSTGRRLLSVYKNGLEISRQSTTPSAADTDPTMAVSLLHDFAVGDYVELRVFQDTGAGLSVTFNGLFTPEFSMARIGT